MWSDLGIILRSYRLGESDRILRIFTREHGKRSAVAKGIRRTTSKFGARLEPLTCAFLLFHTGRSMDIVTQAEIRTSFKELRENLDLFVRASTMAELVDSLTQEHEPHPELFDMLREGLTMMRDLPEGADLALSSFEFKAMACAGFEMRVGDCANCGSALGAEDVSFSLHLGGFACGGCRTRRSGELGKLVRVHKETARLLGWIACHELGDWPDPLPGQACLRELGALMDGILEYWTEREIRSRRVARRMPGAVGREGVANGQG